MADHWKKQGPWPHYLGDCGLSKCSPAPGPSKAGAIRRIAVPIPLTGLIVRPDGTLFGAGFQGVPEQTPGEYAEQKINKYSGARILIHRDQTCEVFSHFGLTRSWDDDGRGTVGYLDATPVIAPDGSEWVYHEEQGFCRFDEIPRETPCWLMPSIHPDGMAAVISGKKLIVGRLGGPRKRSHSLPRAGGAPGSYDIIDLHFRSVSPPAFAPDGTLYFQSVWHLAHDSYDHTSLYAWRLHRLKPGAKGLARGESHEIEDAPVTGRIAVSPGGHVIYPQWRWVRQFGRGVIYEYRADIAFALTRDRGYFLQWGEYRNAVAEPEMVAIDLESGELLWRTEVPLHTPTFVIADGENRIYHTSPGGVTARNSGGKVLFKVEIAELQTLAIGTERTLVISGSDERGPCILMVSEG